MTVASDAGPVAATTSEGAQRWVALGLVIVVTTIGMMSFAAPFPLLPVWIKELGITRAQAGLLTGLWYLPGMAVALPAGYAFDRWSSRRVLLACWCCIAIGMAVMAFARDYVTLCAGRLVFSIGMNAHMVGAPKLVGDRFAGRRELGLVMGLYTLAFTAGVFLSLNVLGRIAQSGGSRPAVMLLAVLSVAGLALVAVLPRSDTNRMGHAANSHGFHPLRLPLGAWIMALAYFGYSIGTEAYLTFAPDFLVQHGMALAAASSAVGAYALIAFVLKPILSSFLNAPRAIAYVCGATIMALVSVALLIGLSGSPYISSAAMGVSLALGMPAFLALPSFLLPAEQSGQGYGLYQMFYSLGFFAQPIVGAVADRAGGYTAGFAVVAVYTVLGFLVAVPAVSAASSSMPGREALVSE